MCKNLRIQPYFLNSIQINHVQFPDKVCSPRCRILKFIPQHRVSVQHVCIVCGISKRVRTEQSRDSIGTISMWRNVPLCRYVKAYMHSLINVLPGTETRYWPGVWSWLISCLWAYSSWEHIEASENNNIKFFFRKCDSNPQHFDSEAIALSITPRDLLSEKLTFCVSYYT